MTMTRTVLGQLLGGLLATAIIGAIIFAAAGRTDLPYVWAVLAITAAFMILSAVVLPPELLRERQHPGSEGRVHDRHRTFVVPLIILSWLLTGLDLGRFHWSDTVPPWLRVVGLVGLAFGLVGTLWAMRTNRFFSSVIRLQLDRGHQPVTTGPYRIVRHPGYATHMLAMLCAGLALGSWLALLPVMVVVLLFVRRTITEDRMLRRDLDGYEAYAARVRSRLVPGVW